MNIYIYSIPKKERISWESPLADGFIALKDAILSNWNIAVIKAGDNGIVLSATKETKEWAKQYSADKEKESKFKSRRIEALISRLQDGECFFIFDADRIDDFSRLSAIDSLNNTTDITKADEVFGIFEKHISSGKKLNENYTPYAYGFDGIKVSVGQPDKEKRVCRFCGRTGANLFKDEAHAISEGLGNKILFCNEECDACNHTLNRIEDNLIALMDVRRAIFGIRRKGTSKVPNINGQNFVIRDDGNGHPMIYLIEEDLPKGWQTGMFSTRLHLKYVTSNENIYKAMVKIAIDLMPSQYLEEFNETVKWLTSDGTFFSHSLQSCHLAVLPSGIFYEQPQLLLYVKNERDKDNGLPYCFAILIKEDEERKRKEKGGNKI